MQEKNMRYGWFLRTKRISDNRGLTLKDIAEELAIPLGTVKTRINRARKMLIAMVENKGTNENA